MSYVWFLTVCVVVLSVWGLCGLYLLSVCALLDRVLTDVIRTLVVTYF